MRSPSTVRRIAETVVEVLRQPLSDEVDGKLAAFHLKDWESSYHWLDANGLALYLRKALQAQQRSGVPAQVRERLDRNQAENRSRHEHHLAEFHLINECFREAGIRYVNLKGFTLEPDYCPDLALRYQCDLDFIVRRADRDKCRTVLESLHYRLTAEDADTLEFKPSEKRLPDMADLYKPRRQHSVEVHFGSPARKPDLGEDCLDRTVSVNRFGMYYPSLGEPDQFFSLIFHMYRHLFSEWIRLSWFYELDLCLRQRAGDATFWHAVLVRADADRDTARALALVLAFSKHAFTVSLPGPLSALCSRSLTKSTQLWIHNYSREMLFSDFPGNKLYLLLLREISTNDSEWRTISRKRLFPLHAPGRALYSRGWAERIKHIPGNTQYGLSRAKFHTRECFRYLTEQWRWNRRIAQADLLRSGSE